MINLTETKDVTSTGLEVLTRDAEGHFFKFGKITLLKKKECIVAVAVGDQAGKRIRLPLSFPCTVDGVEYVVDVPEVAAEPQKAKCVKASLEGGVTKIQRCREIHAANAQLSKAEIVALFISEAQCTPQGANTYYLTCKKG